MALDGSASYIRYLLHGTMFCNFPGQLNLWLSKFDLIIITSAFYFCFPLVTEIIRSVITSVASEYIGSIIIWAPLFGPMTLL